MGRMDSGPVDHARSNSASFANAVRVFLESMQLNDMSNKIFLAIVTAIPEGSANGSAHVGLRKGWQDHEVTVSVEKVGAMQHADMGSLTHGAGETMKT
jgi:hypothetical protein